jgi:hypothetical protein
VSLPEVHRVHEVARLRAQLRHVLNERRSRVHGGYLEDETLLRHKAKLAQSLLNNDGEKPAGLDFSLLQNYADAHSLSLADAARLIMGMVSEGEAILRTTELIKDRLLAQIERITNLRDIQRVQQELEHAAGTRKEL